MARRLVFAMTNRRADESVTLRFSTSLEIGAVDTLSGFAVASWSEGAFVEVTTSAGKQRAGSSR